MTKGDKIIGYFLRNEGLIVKTIDVANGTGLKQQEVSTTISWIRRRNKLANLVRVRKGVYCFKPKGDITNYRNHAEIAYEALNEHGKLNPDQLAEIIDVPVSYVYQVIKLVKQKYPVKIKRQVTYEIEV